MVRAGSFCAVLLFLCACLLLLCIHLASSEFPVHITTTMWLRDDILRQPQTRVPNILPTPPPSPSVPPATFVYHTIRRALGNTLKRIQSPPTNLSTPPPSPRAPPAPYGYRALPGSTLNCLHPYCKAIIKPLPHPSRFLPMANVDSSANLAMISTQNRIPLMPVHLGQQTATFPQPTPRFASPVPMSDQYQCKSFVPPPNASFANPVPPAALDELCKPLFQFRQKTTTTGQKAFLRAG